MARTSIPVIALALVALLASGAAASSSWEDDDCKCSRCPKEKKDRPFDCRFDTPSALQVKTSEDLLFQAFIKVDDAFNDPAILGLTQLQTENIGYWTESSTSLFHSTFSPDAKGHTNHPTQAHGSGMFFGLTETAASQIQFEGALLNDPANFPFDNDDEDAPNSPTVFHNRPKVTEVNGCTMAVAASSRIMYNGTIVGRGESLAHYVYTQDEAGNTVIPQITWIHFITRLGMATALG